MYKMKCPRCGEEMEYTNNEEVEKLDLVCMDCINNCEDGYLVPINNPNLIKINDCSEYDFIECCKQNDKTFVAIKQFKLKENVTINELIKDGFSYSCDCKYLSKILPLKQSIIVCLKVCLSDYTLKIEVLDDDFGQYYTPFYEYQSGGSKTFDYLEKVIDRYNYEINKINNINEV